MKSIQAGLVLLGSGFLSFNASAEPLTAAQVEQVKQNVLTYMSAWNILEEGERVSHLERATNPGFRYQDPTTAGFLVNDAQNVSNWISGFQGQMRDFGLWPFDATLVSNVEIHGSVESTNIRFNWHISALGGAVTVAEGVDYGTASNLKLDSITGFFGPLSPLCRSPQWQAGSTYVRDNQVTFKGAIYKASWWTQDSPEQDAQAWVKLTDCSVAP
ncbi:carbohydrate-binding protein [Pseudoalteromonas luteoviolacea]|uniref:Chitin-binding type-3 domain-containing protein n=1 Tax=Pseudoalteromonas luteoviolacea S4054 TaxID=1129367 RepID=A0A0F6A9K6_9GAMM|nr:hypothetical protein [Pseudoalteromonas luteoviolacea]AOT08639.1 hypothetical protein S4054249_12585 [Pseudoalteromonas luteoviolacea]AOT13554.1 hypothetical protein S40542_12560 [Pseudoalteromonas luteoviolacea]AOT18467.1 hypothetical protein S4054_12560 [Pseudoalteromonas luteoviolacea]KKE82536.1 hypothetical protein N479_18180 [Pseudoalteromonas luteoviolacea S4054]KZN72073.1 hypothetical protein N481_16815 [Pseudoalteromonas luteoviolacea S4047-1]